MQTATIPQIIERLQKLSDDKLGVVYDFVSYLAERDLLGTLRESRTSSYQTMLASSQVLSRDWNKPEEDAAWANL